MTTSVIIQVSFSVAVAIELIYLGLFILTIKMPDFRFWPPPGPRSWQFFASWFMASVVAVIFLILGMADFDSAFLPALRQRAPFTLVLFIPGGALGFWSFASFGLRSTIGLGDRLITGGPYQYTRNPQYLGDSLNIIGFMLLTNSWMVWVIGALGVALNLLAPHTEETWLEERFGESYLAYRNRVPRWFLGV